MKWFGHQWNAPICEDSTHIETPVGQQCFWCEKPIIASDVGVVLPHLGETESTEEPWHLYCLQTSLGVVEH